MSSRLVDTSPRARDDLIVLTGWISSNHRRCRTTSGFVSISRAENSHVGSGELQLTEKPASGF